MKNIYILCFVFSMFPFLASFGQKTGQDVVKSTKKDQSKLYNDVNIAYGIGSLYIFTSNVNHSYPTYDTYSSNRTDINSMGSFMIGYNRMLTKTIMIGFVASYINCTYKRTYYNYEGSSNIGSASFNDNLLNGIARITFNYVNKPVVRVYSSFGMGITVDISNAQGDQAGAVEETDRKILPAGQITFMGVRFGRSFGGFVEFGIGTNAIITGGLNYQFGD
jgi:hypothetical protein